MLRKSINESSEPVEGRLGIEGTCTAKASRISRRAAKLGCARNWGGWGRLSVDEPGQHNPVRSEDPWGRAIKVARMAALKRTTSPTQSGDIQVGSDQRDGGKQTRWARRLGASFGKAPSDRPALKPYWGKPAVRNFRGGDGNVGIIRSPVRAIVLPDNRHEVEDESSSRGRTSLNFSRGVKNEGRKVDAGCCWTCNRHTPEELS